MPSSVRRQRQFPPRRMVNGFALFIPTHFKIASDSGKINDSFRRFRKQFRCGNHPPHRRHIIFIVTGKMENSILLQNTMQLRGEIRRQQPMSAVPILRPRIRTEQMQPVQRLPGQHPGNQITRFGPQYDQIRQIQPMTINLRNRPTITSAARINRSG